MNSLYAFLFSLTLTTSLMAQSESTKLWIDLTAKVQNVHHDINLLGKGVSPDPSAFTNRLKAIDDSLEALVKHGELQSHRITFKTPTGKDSEKDFQQKLLKIIPKIDALGDRYGIYLAREMCDMGARRSMKNQQPNSTVSMHIRLPKKEINAYLGQLQKIGLIKTAPKNLAPPKTTAKKKPVVYQRSAHWFIVPSFAKRAQLIIHALDTADKYSHLPYKFGSADPKNGGFDCSGATSYVMKKSGLKPPRTSAQQFIWIRNAGKIHYISKEVDSLKNRAFQALIPGDLLFWSGTYVPTDGRSVKITHVGIYLGTEKDGRHIMACATNGRSYRGKRGNGYGIYDFRLPRKTSKATFVGYGAPM